MSLREIKRKVSRPLRDATERELIEELEQRSHVVLVSQTWPIMPTQVGCYYFHREKGGRMISLNLDRLARFLEEEDERPRAEARERAEQP